MGNRFLLGESALPRATAVVAAALVSTAGTGVALGQPAITIEVDNPVLLPGESTTVTMFAGFGPPDYAVFGIDTDFVSSVGSDGWAAVGLISPMNGPGTTPGTSSAAGFDGIIAVQLQYLGAGIYADPTNPIPFWRGTYTAPSDAVVPFEVDLATMTRWYEVYPSMTTSRSESRIDELVEGSGTIRVIPAPASVIALAMGAACLRRPR